MLYCNQISRKAMSGTKNGQVLNCDRIHQIVLHRLYNSRNPNKTRGSAILPLLPLTSIDLFASIFSDCWNCLNLHFSHYEWQQRCFDMLSHIYIPSSDLVVHVQCQSTFWDLQFSYWHIFPLTSLSLYHFSCCVSLAFIFWFLVDDSIFFFSFVILLLNWDSENFMLPMYYLHKASLVILRNTLPNCQK